MAKQEPGWAWLARHIVVGGLALLAVVVLRLRSDWHWMHAWNRAFADVALVLLVVTLIAGSLARLASRGGWMLSLRREAGIWTVILSIVHVWIVLANWVEWDLTRLWKAPWPHGMFFDPAFAMGNLVGLAALAYGVVLLATSNDLAMRLLGSGWKFLQRGATIHFVLTALHAAYFLFLHFQATFHRAAPPLNGFRTPFIGLVALVFALQAIAFAVTVRRERAGRRRA